MGTSAERMRAEHKPGKKRHAKPNPEDHFVMLPNHFLDEPAWKALKAGSRVLYIAIKRYYNGHNNGAIFLSVRKAAADTRLSKSAIERYFAELKEMGFIREGAKGYLGVEGQGQASSWILTEIGVKGAQPTKDYRNWRPKI